MFGLFQNNPVWVQEEITGGGDTDETRMTEIDTC